MTGLKEYQILPKTSKRIVQVPRFLEGDFGKEVNEEVQAKYRKFPGIKNIGYNPHSMVIEGSSSFYATAVNEVLRGNGLNGRTTTQSDVEKILKNRDLALLEHYVDTGLVLRSRDGPNAYLAKLLVDQVKLRNFDQEMPVIISLKDLDLKEDQDSSYGLAFKLRENVEVIYAPILKSKEGRKEETFLSENIDEKSGLPKKLGGGDRMLYTNHAGLSRIWVTGGSYLDTYNSNLAFSSLRARVVLVCDEVTGVENKK